MSLGLMGCLRIVGTSAGATVRRRKQACADRTATRLEFVRSESAARRHATPPLAPKHKSGGVLRPGDCEREQMRERTSSFVLTSTAGPDGVARALPYCLPTERSPSFNGRWSRTWAVPSHPKSTRRAVARGSSLRRQT